MRGGGNQACNRYHGTEAGGYIRASRIVAHKRLLFYVVFHIVHGGRISERYAYFSDFTGKGIRYSDVPDRLRGTKYRQVYLHPCIQAYRSAEFQFTFLVYRNGIRVGGNEDISKRKISAFGNRKALRFQFAALSGNRREIGGMAYSVIARRNRQRRCDIGNVDIVHQNDDARFVRRQSLYSTQGTRHIGTVAPVKMRRLIRRTLLRRICALAV